MKFPSPSSADAVVAITDLSRRFGSKAALDNVSLYVPRGGVFGLVGENGAGKTTLIKHILGLLRAETGSVSVSASIRSPIPSLSSARSAIFPKNRTCPAGCAWMN
jgi:ABC-2 type transport system ATP-binding protein